MRDIPTRRKLHPALVLALLAAVGSAASADDRDRGDLRARLKGYDEVPAVSSAARGQFRASVDRVANTLRYELSYSGLEGDVRQAHIHFGRPGTAGGIMIWLCQTSFSPSPVGSPPSCPQSGTVQGVASAADVVGPGVQGIAAAEFAEALAAIRSGVAYVNVHSAKFPSGEIRGQVDDD